MTAPTLWQRLKQARIVQVLVVYSGATWFILQLVGTLRDLLSLPDWVGPVTVILLAVGLVVVAATAWVQSLDSTTAAEEAGERPTDWEIAPADAIARLKAGKLPQLTWGRAIAGGVVAISLAIGVAGGYVLVTGGSGLIGPAEIGADEVATGIAVVPFTISGEGYEQYREGLVDLLSQNLDGVGGYRTIDNRTVLARWAEVVGDEAAPDLDMTLRAAGQTGARYAMVGGLTAAGSEIRLSVDIYDLDDGAEIGSRVQVEGEPDDFLGLVDELSVGLARELLGEDADAVGSAGRIASITTGSLEALDAYLEGERLIRLGDFLAAIEPLERAVAIDTTFALAYARLGEASAWSTRTGVAEARLAAGRHRDRLSTRESILVQTRELYTIDDPAGYEMLLDFVRRYPDEAEGYYQLAEYPLHKAHLVSVSRSQVRSWLATAAELDPGFTPYHIHLVEMGLASGESAFTQSWIDRYYAFGGNDFFGAGWRTTYPAIFGTVAEREAVADSARPDPSGFSVFATATYRTDFPGRELPFVRSLTSDGDALSLGIALVRAGRLEEFTSLLRTGSALLSARLAGPWFDPYGLVPEDVLHAGLGTLLCPNPLACFDRESARAIHAARAGHGDELAGALLAQDRFATEALEGVDPQDPLTSIASTGAGSYGRIPTAIAGGLEITRAHVAFHEGRPDDALAILDALHGETHVDFLLMARAAEATGDLARAEELYLNESWQIMGPAATLDLARLYERTDRPVQALQQWRRFLVMWEEADEGLAPLTEARQAVARLGG